MIKVYISSTPKFFPIFPNIQIHLLSVLHLKTNKDIDNIK